MPTEIFRRIVAFLWKWAGETSGGISVICALLGRIMDGTGLKTVAYLALLLCCVIEIGKRWNLEERLRPKLKLACGVGVSGSKVTTVMNFSNAQGQILGQKQSNFFRIVVELAGIESADNCSGFLTYIRKDGEIRMANESLQLTFAPGDRADAIAKTLRNKIPAHLDVIAVLQDNQVMICLPGFRSPNVITNQNMFAEVGDYILTVVIAGHGFTSVSRDLTFRWTGDWSTAELFLR